MKKVFKEVDLEQLNGLVNDLARGEGIRFDIEGVRGFAIQVSIMSYLRGMKDAAKDMYGENLEGVEFILKEEVEDE